MRRSLPILGLLLALVAAVAASVMVGSAGPEEARQEPRGDQPAPRQTGSNPLIPTRPTPLPTQAPPEPAEKEPEPVRFLAWGDSGHGNDAQRRVGQAAARVCASEGCDFVVLLGDNVYPKGVHGLDDPQWRSKFEEPYAMLNVTFHPVLGNHDVGLGKVDGADRDNGDFMVRYQSDRWDMPDRHYEIRRSNVQVLALDLTAVADRRTLEETGQEAQAAWLDETWDEDDGTWRFAASHFPYLSNGAHGSAGHYDGKEGKGAALKRLVEEKVCGKADVYLAAHDHDLQWLAPVPECGDTEFIVSGAASDPREIRAQRHEALFQKGGALGFFWFEIRGDTLVGRAYDEHGNVLFERTLRK